jgi:hypothetical protein
MPNTTESQSRSHARAVAQSTAGRLSRWTGPLALLLAAVAVVLAAWALTTRTSAGPSTTSRTPEVLTQSGDPKTRVCKAFDAVSSAVSLQSHTDLGPDAIAQSAVAGNARLALLGGGLYLLSRLDVGTPTNLADAVRSFADDLQDIGMYALAEVPNGEPNQAARLVHADQVRQQIVDLCK